MLKRRIYWRRAAIAGCTFMLVSVIAGCGGFFASGDTVTSLALTPSNATVQVNGTEQYVAMGTTADGNTRDVTPGAQWSSSNPSIATINSNGLATAISAGTTAIRAKYENGDSETFLTVTSGTLTAIAISPTNQATTAGLTLQFSATGTFSDGSTRDVTSSVSWTSSNTSVATINSTGLATAVAPGSTVITATSGSLSSVTTLTVGQ